MRHMQWVLARFQLKQRGTTVGRELRGAVATFLTMAYILAANPAILSAAGIPVQPAIACTALAAGICCLLMGFVGNFPLALASGMGLNALIAFELTARTGSWQVAMGLVVLDGILILILVLCGAREAMIHAIPADLRRAIAAGIGLFIALLGAANAGLIEQFPQPGPLLKAGSFAQPHTIVSVIGLVVTAALMIRRVPGALILGIAISTVAAIAKDAILGTSHVVTDVPEFVAVPSFEIAFQAKPLEALRLAYIPLLLALMLVDFFDTLGSVTALAEQAGLADAEGRVPGLRRILVVDSLSASIGGLLGVSSVTSYIESAAGVAEGARTGLHSVFVGLMFLAAIFLAPVVAIVPAAATAPALILVGFLMCESLRGISFTSLPTGIPAFLIILLIPLTSSIAHGIGVGFVCFVILKLTAGRARDIHPLMAATAALFVAYFATGL